MEAFQSPLVVAQETPSPVVNFVVIAVYVLAAILVSLFSRRLARPIVLAGRRLPGKPAMAPSRQKTLESLIASLISLLGFVLATVRHLLALRRLGTPYLDHRSVQRGIWPRRALARGRYPGRDALHLPQYIHHRREGRDAVGGSDGGRHVEEVNVTNTLIRAPSGEAYVVPNGDIMVITQLQPGPLLQREDQALRQERASFDRVGHAGGRIRQQAADEVPDVDRTVSGAFDV